MRPRYKAWALPLLKQYPTLVKLQTQATFDVLEFWPNTEIEIGIGKGDYIIELAKRTPATLFIGVEQAVSVAASALKKILASELNNIRLLVGPAEYWLAKLPAQSITTLYLNFSDPWPKTKYHKRRLTHPNYLKTYKQILTNNGKIVMKTDNQALFDYSLKQFTSASFLVITVDRDFRSQLTEDPFTEYERKFSALGLPIYRCEVKKINEEETRVNHLIG